MAEAAVSRDAALLLDLAGAVVQRQLAAPLDALVPPCPGGGALRAVKAGRPPEALLHQTLDPVVQASETAE